MVDTASTLEISLDDCFLSDEEARELIAGGAIMMTGGRSMDAKAQIVV